MNRDFYVMTGSIMWTGTLHIGLGKSFLELLTCLHVTYFKLTFSRTMWGVSEIKYTRIKSCMIKCVSIRCPRIKYVSIRCVRIKCPRIICSRIRCLRIRCVSIRCSRIYHYDRVIKNSFGTLHIGLGKYFLGLLKCMRKQRCATSREGANKDQVTPEMIIFKRSTFEWFGFCDIDLLVGLYVLTGRNTSATSYRLQC